MKLWHWLLVLVALYELVIGAAELMTSAGSNPLASLVSYPSVGSVVQSSAGSGMSTTIAGGLDVTTAILIYLFLLHGRIFHTA